MESNVDRLNDQGLFDDRRRLFVRLWLTRYAMYLGLLIELTVMFLVIYLVVLDLRVEESIESVKIYNML